MKTLIVLSTTVLVCLACSDNTVSIAQPESTGDLPRAADGISPTEYIELHNLGDQLERLMSDTLHKDIIPEDTLFAGDYLVDEDAPEGRTITIRIFDNEGNEQVFIYNFGNLCGSYIIIHGPESVGFLTTYEGCPEQLPDGYTRYVGSGADDYIEQ